MASLFSEVSPQITDDLNKSGESRFDSQGYHARRPMVQTVQKGLCTALHHEYFVAN